jgi:hypothetical protein
MSYAPQNIGSIVRVTTALRPVSQVAIGSFGLNGITIDRLANAHDSAVFHIAVGAATGTPSAIAVDAKLQQRDAGGTFADVVVSKSNPAVAITQIVTSNVSRVLSIDLRGLRREVRLVFQVAFTGGTTPAIPISAIVALGGALKEPVVQSAP